MINSEQTLIDFIQPNDLIKMMGRIFTVDEIWDTKVVLYYGLPLKATITYVTEVYKLNLKGDYICVWRRDND